jgi:hypothetical protein
MAVQADSTGPVLVQAIWYRRIQQIIHVPPISTRTYNSMLASLTLARPHIPTYVNRRCFDWPRDRIPLPNRHVDSHTLLLLPT